MDALVFFAAVAVVLWGIDRLLTGAESRGWIYWRKQKRGSALGNVMGALDAIYNPARKHQQAEVRRIQDSRDDIEDGAPPEQRGKPRAPERRRRVS